MADHPGNRRLALQLQTLVGDELPGHLVEAIRVLAAMEQQHGTDIALGTMVTAALAALVFAGELDRCRGLLVRSHQAAEMMARAAGPQPIGPCQGRA